MEELRGQTHHAAGAAHTRTQNMVTLGSAPRGAEALLRSAHSHKHAMKRRGRKALMTWGERS